MADGENVSRGAGRGGGRKGSGPRSAGEGKRGRSLHGEQGGSRTVKGGRVKQKTVEK